MPSKPTAIQLTYKNIDVINSALGIPVKELVKDLEESISDGHPWYYVKEPLYRGNRIHHLIYTTERAFLTDFAIIPRGIQDSFVPVTPIQG